MRANPTIALLCLLPASLASGSVLAAELSSGTTPGKPAAQAAWVSEAAPLSSGERQSLARRFEEKWGHYVARVYEVPLDVWSERMASSFAIADPANLRRALERETFEGAMAELNGTGHRLGDGEVIDRLAESAAPGAARFDIQQLGSLGSDLTYTPIRPCRIVDTRVAGGAISANGVRNFKAVNSASFTSQGGSATNCGTLGLGAGAVALNIVAVTPSSAGYATVYPFGEGSPVAASVNYTAGAVVNNSIVTAIPNPPLSLDFTVYTFAESHFVIDIVGYFAPPAATALECSTTFVSETVAGNASFDIEIPACPVGYTLLGAGCNTPGPNDADWGINGLYQGFSGDALGAFCTGINKQSGNITVRGTANCCRVPGR